MSRPQESKPLRLAIALGLHIGDIGDTDHPKMAEWILAINRSLLSENANSRVIAWFGHTGNFIIETQSDDFSKTSIELYSASGETFLVMPVACLKECLARLDRLPMPAPKDGVRWTAGASFRMEDPADYGQTPEDWSTTNGFFFPLTRTVVGVRKRDRLLTLTKLNPRHRVPWGSVGRDCGRRLGGTWTSRSVRTLRGLLRICPKV